MSLFVLRHAKSSWDDASLSDFERPLNQRGLNAAPVIGHIMARKGLVPELIISSPAERAKQTAILVKDAAGSSAEIKFDGRIYEASLQTLLYVLFDASEKLNAIMLVGHNPGFEGLIRFLTGRTVSMPTAALAVTELDINAWKDLSGGCGRLIEIVLPKDDSHNPDNAARV